MVAGKLRFAAVYVVPVPRFRYPDLLKDRRKPSTPLFNIIFRPTREALRPTRQINGGFRRRGHSAREW